MKHIIENGKHYDIRHGRRFEVVTVPDLPEKPRRKPFKTKFATVPMRWIEALEQSDSVSTYRLALRILAEDFKRKNLGGEIKLSSVTTGMPKSSKRRAARELQKLGLIQIERRSGRQASIIHIVHIKEEE